MEYRHITTGVIVHSDSELPPAIYEKVVEKQPEPEAKPAKKGKSRKTKEQ